MAAETTTVTRVATPKTTVKSASGSKTIVKRSIKGKAARQRAKAQRAVEVAKQQIGDPYRWGATGPGAFDCSGLAVYAWRKAGVKLPRTTYAQRRAVKKKISWRNLQPGDLIFTSGGGHVGIYVGKGRMVHSPHSGARVRIDKLNSYRKRTFVGAVRPGA